MSLQNIVASNNRHVLSHNFCRSQVHRWLNFVVLAQDLLWGLSQDCQQELQLSAFLLLRRLFPKWLTRMPGKLVLDVGRELSFPHHLGISIGSKYLYNIAAGSLQSTWSEGQLMLKPCSFMAEPWKDIVLLPYCVGHTDQSWHTVEGDYTGMYTRRERSLGTIWEACHEISEERPSAFQSVWGEVLFRNSYVNSLWRKTSWVQSLW